ncbi:hypothetical protein F4604DRAFT_1936869 [Suillus subluteus]|nr:hypothetical protein F4604DRAFT_1936869 [Suillus subluteus]
MSSLTPGPVTVSRKHRYWGLHKPHIVKKPHLADASSEDDCSEDDNFQPRFARSCVVVETSDEDDSSVTEDEVLDFMRKDRPSKPLPSGQPTEPIAQAEPDSHSNLAADSIQRIVPSSLPTNVGTIRPLLPSSRYEATRSRSVLTPIGSLSPVLAVAACMSATASSASASTLAPAPAPSP